MAGTRLLDRLFMHSETLAAAWRRQQWLFDDLSVAKVWNTTLCLKQFLLKREEAAGWPVVLKVDISPLCNLRCTVCVHARPGEGEAELETQSFRRGQMMSLEQFQRILDEVKGRTCAISMYYLGDPLMHPDLHAMCRAAADARLNTHVSTNLSFRMSDERITGLVTSGLTHLTVCVDGLTQESYGRTRVGGRIALVLENLERVLAERKRLGRCYPKVEAQYIKFQHNVAELDEARRLFARLGVDRVAEFWGSLARASYYSPPRHDRIRPKAPRAVPHCFWPYFSMQIKYNGDVIPCCTYRHTAQYGAGDARAVGNVFESSVWDVWNSEAYAALRRLVSDPVRASGDGATKDSFCNGCTTVFDVQGDSAQPRAGENAWEDYYELGPAGHVVPLPGTYSPERAVQPE